jgi:hypothetical protein
MRSDRHELTLHLVKFFLFADIGYESSKTQRFTKLVKIGATTAIHPNIFPGIMAQTEIHQKRLPGN